MYLMNVVSFSRTPTPDVLTYSHFAVQLNWNYAAPALQAGKSPVDGGFYLLALLPKNDILVDKVPAAQVQSFVVEYFAATYTSPEDWGCLVRMMDDCQACEYLGVLATVLTTSEATPAVLPVA
jgi:hypothetical protein